MTERPDSHYLLPNGTCSACGPCYAGDEKPRNLQHAYNMQSQIHDLQRFAYELERPIADIDRRLAKLEGANWTLQRFGARIDQLIERVTKLERK